MESLLVLQGFIEKAGFEVRIGTIDPAIKSATLLETASNKKVLVEPLSSREGKVYLGDFVPDLVILNNDLSAGIPAILENISQPVAPALELGWSRRLKSGHFANYKQVAREFADIIDLDPWLISPMVRNCGKVNFMQHEGVDCLQNNTEILLKAIQEKYDQYNVDSKPFVIVKADAGTYGMGIMTIHSADEIMQLNRKQRTRMSKN